MEGDAAPTADIFTQSDPPQFVAVIDEMVLRRTGEDVRGLMVEQITHLISCAEQPSVSVHIVPAEVGLHVGLSGPFVLARGADGGWVGHLEKQLGGTVVDTEDGLATLLARWESVRNEALSAGSPSS